MPPLSILVWSHGGRTATRSAAILTDTRDGARLPFGPSLNEGGRHRAADYGILGRSRALQAHVPAEVVGL